MPVTAHRFNSRKVLEAIVYIASKTPAPGFHKISKIFYFADKLHLERYGSMFSGDTYIAMDNGPVPSHIYDFMKYAGGKNVALPFASEKVKAALKESLGVSGYHVSAKRAPDCDYLSDSEIACLDEIIASHGRKTFGQLTDESHDSAWGSVAQDAPIPPSEIIKTLPSSGELLDHYFK
ncbi:Panacea domain-containing protein [Pseudoduganella sp. R-43]|uniref:Panacea domain-containing protein n=1 Tax=Pseudoduganella sp. R-43 TaxID=3404063 RepID=UPI003CF062B3